MFRFRGVQRRWPAVWGYVAQQCLNALVVSAFYALIAVAYVLFHGIANRFNLAFGALAMWAGYLAVGFLAGGLWHFRLSPAVLLGIVAAGSIASTAVVGGTLGHLVARPLLRQPALAMLIATIGAAIVLEEVMRLAAGSRELWVRPILGDTVAMAEAGGFAVQATVMQIVVLAACLTLASGLAFFISRHRFGRLWRACAQDIRMAELLGVDAGRVLFWTMVLSSAYAAAAGVLMGAYYGSASFYVGFVIGMKALFVAILGGLDSIRGAFVGALFLGGVETLWSAFLPGDWRDVAAFAALTFLIVLMPGGIMAAAQRIDPRI